jgi:hypothetical protein
VSAVFIQGHSQSQESFHFQGAPAAPTAELDWAEPILRKRMGSWGAGGCVKIGR